MINRPEASLGTGTDAPTFPVVPSPSFVNVTTSGVRDLLITAVEINHQHGVGVLLQRLFPESRSFACVRSFTVYNGITTFGSGDHLVLDQPRHPDDVRSLLTQYLEQWKIRRILCVPYYPADFVHAVIAKEITGVPLVTYIMDDQNVFGPQVPDQFVDRLLRVSDLRLGISWELCVAYQKKFKHTFELLPPVLTERAPFVTNYWRPTTAEPLRAAMIGNVWTARRFRQLRSALRRASLQIDWYGNGQDASWLEGSMEEWERDGIRCLGHLPEEDLVVALASYPYVLVPSGTCDEDDDNPAFSRLSLPSRMLFLHARTDTPLLVLGSDLGAAGHFVREHGTGICCAPGENLARAQLALTDPVRRAACQQRIRGLASDLVLPNAGDWIWESLEKGTATPAPFNRVFQPPTAARVASVTSAVNLTESSNLRRHRVAIASGAYSTHAHFREVKDAGLLPQSWNAGNAELMTFMRSYAAWRVAKMVSPGDDLLFLGDEIPTAALALFPSVRIWRVRDPAWLWRERTKTVEYVCISGGAQGHDAPPEFQAVWSAGFASSVPHDPASCARVAAFCDAACAAGGNNLHFFSAVAHRDFNWVHPLHDAFLQRSGQEKTWPGFAEMFGDDDAFFMSAEAYAHYWQPSTGRLAHEFGRCCWFGVSWKGPSFFNQSRRRFWKSPLGQRVIALQQKFR